MLANESNYSPPLFPIIYRFWPKLLLSCNQRKGKAGCMWMSMIFMLLMNLTVFPFPIYRSGPKVFFDMLVRKGRAWCGADARWGIMHVKKYSDSVCTLSNSQIILSSPTYVSRAMLNILQPSVHAIPHFEHQYYQPSSFLTEGSLEQRTDTMSKHQSRRTRTTLSRSSWGLVA